MRGLLLVLAPLVAAGCVVSADPGQVDGDLADSAVDSINDSRVPDTSAADTSRPPVDSGSSSTDTGALDTRLPDTALVDTGSIDAGTVDAGVGCKLSDSKICGPAAIGDGCLRMGAGATSCGKMGTGTEGASCAKDADCKPGHVCDTLGEICGAQKNTCRRLCLLGSTDCGAMTCKAFSELLCGSFFSSPFKYGSITYGGCIP